MCNNLRRSIVFLQLEWSSQYWACITSPNRWPQFLIRVTHYHSPVKLCEETRVSLKENSAQIFWGYGFHFSPFMTVSLTLLNTTDELAVQTYKPLPLVSRLDNTIMDWLKEVMLTSTSSPSLLQDNTVLEEWFLSPQVRLTLPPSSIVWVSVSEKTWTFIQHWRGLTETRSFIFDHERRFPRKLCHVLRKRCFYSLGMLLLKLVKRYFGAVPSTKRTSQNLKLRGHAASVHLTVHALVANPMNSVKSN